MLLTKAQFWPVDDVAWADQNRIVSNKFRLTNDHCYKIIAISAGVVFTVNENFLDFNIKILRILEP